jgi:CRISPR-associated protein Cst2
MARHVFAAIVTGHGTAANNRGVTEGNVTTLQKLVWNGQVHTTVSAEAIRFALRRRLAEIEECNRTFDDERRVNTWRDPEFARWAPKARAVPHIDDDLLGFMSAKAAEQEGTSGTADVRRAVLELTRAVSLTPWPGDVTFNAASPNATPSAQKRGTNPVPYATELHATRYQYGLAITPGRLREPGRAAIALRALCALGEVAGNQGRFLYDFAPDAVVFRVTEDPAPRILYAFTLEDGRLRLPEIVRKVKGRDIEPSELVLGGAVDAGDRAALDGAEYHEGVRAACESVCRRLSA